METQLAMPIETEQHGDVVVWRLAFGFLPPSKNVYDNWPPQWKHGAKKKWAKHIAMQCAEQQIPTGLQRVGLAARLVFPKNARRDPQNFAQALWHWVPDALVGCGVLVDDRDGAIEIGPNWGIELAVDSRPLPADRRKRTVLTIATRMP